MNPPEPLQKLHNLDKTSPQFYQEINEFIRGKDYREAVPNLQGEGLTWLVDYLDGVIVGISNPADPVFQSLRELRRICGIKEVLPSSCTLSDALSDVALSPASEYVYVGTLNGSGVRIRRTGAYSKRGSRKVMKAFYQAAVVWRHLSHPNILPLLGVTTNPLQLVSDSRSGVTLPGYIIGNPRADRRSLLSDIAAGLSYLHLCDLIHGDLAGSDIVVDVTGRAKITDFGVTMITQNLDLTQSAPAEDVHGSRWIAPEILGGRSTYSKEGDVFSFAMVAIEVFTSAAPFNDKPPRAAVSAIMGGERPLRPTHPALTVKLWALIQRCWDQEALQRPSAPQILHGVIPVWKRLINPSLDPKERVPLIGTIFSDRDELDMVKGLSGEDAQSFIDIADELLDSLERRLQKKCLKILCKICGSRALLPRSIQVPIHCDRSGDSLYSGGYADVWEGECKGLKVAVKVLRVRSRGDFDQVIHRFCKEAMTWKTLHHPNVLPLLGVSMHSKFSMASEWMENGNIIEFVKVHRDANRFKLLKDVTLGLIYMHSEEMVHGDLKGANILINKHGDAVLADFGLLTIVSDSTYSSTSGSFSIAGTTRWMGPELFDPEQVGHKSDQPTEKSDCYALGMTILEVLSGRQPFHYYKDLIVMQKIRNGEQPKIPTGPERVWFTNDLWEMLGLCWLPKPESRPTIEAVLENLEYGVATWEPLPPGLEEETHTYDDDSHSTVTSLVDQAAPLDEAEFQPETHEASQSQINCWGYDFQEDTDSDGDESADSTATIHAPAPRKVEPLPIPQRQYGQLHYESYRTKFGLETPIIFPSSSGKKGILLGDAVNEDTHDLVGGDEAVFTGYTCPAVSLRILWPGYAFWIQTIEIRDWRSGQKRINKAQLAIEIAKKVNQFTQEMIDVPIKLGSEEWRVGPGFIEANNLVLVSLVNVTEGSWQPELRLLPKPPSEEPCRLCL